MVLELYPKTESVLMSEYELYCPTCDMVCNEFNDTIPAVHREHHGIHRKCGKYVQLRIKNFKSSLKNSLTSLRTKIKIHFTWQEFTNLSEGDQQQIMDEKIKPSSKTWRFKN